MAGPLYLADPFKVLQRIVTDTHVGHVAAPRLCHAAALGDRLCDRLRVRRRAAIRLRRVPRLSNAVEPYIMASVGIPKYALVPLFILWFGIDDAPKLVADRAAGVLSDLHRGVRRHPQRRPPADQHGARRRRKRESRSHAR